ncbi:imidazole glycerol phosphate synthase subunit HisH [Staphylococcus sp. GDH8C107P]|uniref:imidazole glycerol phosphate synthase subunit HisH n=1 Tax=Staphylococcus sp. GDH8C107P TaxID=2804087 RepID=UPI001AEBEA12|nr:imidazole glycerol phosphate synthase subunit HisH [Staphylococcus sp. GDH8C107P]
MIAIIDYGLGNIKNIQRAVEHLGYNSILTDQPSEISQADAIILPGVGHFRDAMQAIASRNLITTLQQITNIPVIGICLGMQLMYEHSAEGDVDGLKLIPGIVIPIKTTYPVPHLGWNNLSSSIPTLNKDVYFVHSYQAEMSPYVVAYADYGTLIPAIVQYKNFTGIQFHPEKSGMYGLSILNQALQGGFSNDQTLASN